MDPLEKSQTLPIAFEDIPTPEEHRREVRGIFTVCITVAVTLLIVGAASVLLALRNGVPLQTIAFVVPIVMGICIATFAIAYAIPVGLVSLRRLEIAYRMGYFGLNQSREATTSIKDVAAWARQNTKPVQLTAAKRPVEVE